MPRKESPSRYHDILRSYGFKVTTARLRMLELLDRIHTPLTASEIHHTLKTGSPGLSADLATVYRSLNKMADEGLLNRVELGDTYTRFEYQHAHHHHIVCVDCGKISPVHLCNLNELVREITAHTGFTDIEHDVIFRGHCGCKVLT